MRCSTARCQLLLLPQFSACSHPPRGLSLPPSSLTPRFSPKNTGTPAVNRSRKGVVRGMARAPASASNYVGAPEKPEQVPQSTPAASPLMQEKMEFAKRHFQYCFKGVLDKEHIDDNVFFMDPLSKITFFKGYWFNLGFLRNFFRPIFEVHDIRQSRESENEMLIRWTMSMQFWFNRYLPSKFVWDPRLVFSGITVLGIDPQSGKINKHVDQWDALEDNQFLSLEGVRFVLSQMLSFSRPMDAETPEYQILKRYKYYEVRKYKPFLMAKAGTGAADAYNSPLKRGNDADTLLAAYFEGNNEKQQPVLRTTPVFRDSQGNAWRYLGAQFKAAGDAPVPKDSKMVIEEHPGGLFGAVLFSGAARKEDVQKQWRLLTEEVRKGGLKPSDSAWVLAEYNTAWTLGPWRRNEVLVPLDEASFKLWEERLPH